MAMCIDVYNDDVIFTHSWGTNWGMEGYVMMSKDMNNQCGIATEASYPIVS